MTTAGNGIKETKAYLKLVANGLGCHLCSQLQVISTMYFDNRWGCTKGEPKYKAKVEEQIERASE